MRIRKYENNRKYVSSAEFRVNPSEVIWDLKIKFCYTRVCWKLATFLMV